MSFEKAMKKRFILTTAVLFFFFSTLLHTAALYAMDEATVRRSISEGRELYNEKYYLGAIEKWSQTLKIDPWNEEAKLLIEKALRRFEELNRNLEEGFGLLEEGNADEAREKFLYVKNNSSPRNIVLHSLVLRGIESAAILPKRIEAKGYFESGDMDRSKLMWHEILELVPGDEEAALFLSKISFEETEKEKIIRLAEGYFNSGMLLYEKEEYEDAVDQFENSIAMNFRVEDSKRYIQEIREAVLRKERLERERSTERVANYLREGIKFYNLNRFRDSLTALNEGLKLDPENSQIKEYIVRVIIALKREEEKTVPATSPFFKLVQNLRRLGTEAHEIGDYHAAIKYWEEILLIFPFNEEARLNLTRALNKTDPALAREILAGMYSEAQGLIERGERREAAVKLKLILKVDPNFSDARAILKDLEESRLRERMVVTEENRKSAREHYEKGLEYYNSEKLEDAIEMWREAVTLNPEFVEARVFLSRAETKLRNLRIISSAGGGKPAVLDDKLNIKIKKHYLYGITYFMDGLYKEAITEWKEVLKLNPTHEAAYMNIERAKKRLAMADNQDSL